MRAVLVVDVDDDMIGEVDYTVLTKKEMVNGRAELRPLPSRWIPQVNGLRTEQQIRNIDFASGWNTCLKKITGETE